MKKIIIGFVSIVCLIIVVIAVIKFITPISSVTIKNATGETLSNVLITYDDHKERIGIVENNESKQIKISSEGEIGILLSYTSGNGTEYRSRELYMEPRGYHITFKVHSRGRIEEDLKLK